MNFFRNLSLVFLFALAFSINGLTQNTVTHTGYFIENKGQIVDQNGFQVPEVKYHMQSQNLNAIAFNTSSVNFTTGQEPSCSAATGISTTNTSGCSYLIS
jgi:hypothetical protein